MNRSRGLLEVAKAPLKSYRTDVVGRINRCIAYILICLGSPLAAAPPDFDFKAETKRLSKERATTGIEKISTEQWVYSVTVENKSSKDFAGIDVQYRVFTSDVKPGVKGPPARVRTNGSTTLAEIKARTKNTFTTNPVELTKSQLAGGTTWGSGARPRVADVLDGIWVRLYKDGELIGEFAKPPNLSTKEQWEAGEAKKN
jgi:hypothetical protein